MEEMPALRGETVSGDDSSETVSTASPPVEDDELETISEDEVEEIEFESTPAPEDREEFERRVSRLMEMMEDDPKVRDRVLAETYVNIASAEQGIRGVFEMVQSQGMAGFAKGMFRRK